MEIDKRIKQDLKIHFENTMEKIKTHDKWKLVNIPGICEKELLNTAKTYGLENDPQTREFCKFIAIGTNFASSDFRDRIQTIPVLVKSIKDLITKIQQEIKEFADIACIFQTLIQAFLKVVMNTKHNMNMALPHLEESLIHLEILSDALAPDLETNLNNQDLDDIDVALTNMSNGIQKLIQQSKFSKDQSIELDQKLNNLKENLESKVTVVENRISFGKLLPKIGATIGLISGASVTSIAVESIAFGGTGVLVLGGLSFPPIGAILLGAAVGALGIGSLLLLIIKLWEKHQFKALGYLKQILENLNELNSANLAFLNYMNKSEEDANKLLNNIDFFKRNVKSSSPRYRKMNCEVCRKSLKSTRDMIQTIKEIDEINLKKWLDDYEVPSYKILEEESIQM